MAVPLDLFCSHTKVLLQPYLAAFLLWSNTAPDACIVGVHQVWVPMNVLSCFLLFLWEHSSENIKSKNGFLALVQFCFLLAKRGKGCTDTERCYKCVVLMSRWHRFVLRSSWSKCGFSHCFVVLWKIRRIMETWVTMEVVVLTWLLVSVWISFCFLPSLLVGKKMGSPCINYSKLICKPVL